jgi:glycosyltransferase involved in cell wall biosynthesis
MRLLQYLPALAAASIEVSTSPLLDDDYLRALYADRKAWSTVISGYSLRVAKLLGAGQYDLVWVEKEALPWLPAWLDNGLLPRSCKLVADYDDAWFHRYDLHRSSMVRRVLGRKIDAVMRRADLVTAGNAYLAQRARDAGARRIEDLPTVVDLERYPACRGLRDDTDELVVGWIGSPSTAERYLRMVAPVLEHLRKDHRIRCIAVGAQPEQVEGTPFEAEPWTEEGEVESIQKFDIGIMPSKDEPWARGKCGYKLIQYMACALPVVASPVGVNREIVLSGENGELANSLEEWKASLERLLMDSGLRRRMGEMGRRRVQEWYSLQVQAPRLISMLQSLRAA